MIDIETQNRVTVNTDPGGAAPFLMVPLDQLPEIRRVLEQNGIAYNIGPNAVKFEGKPFIAMVNFDRRTDANRIQAALDAA